MQGYEKLGKTAIIATIGQFCPMSLTFLLVKGLADTWLAVLIPSLTTFFSALITLAFVIRMRVIGLYRVEPQEIGSRIKDSVHVFLASFGANMFDNSNVLFLASATNMYRVGLYNGADRLKKAANSLPEHIDNAFFPA
ncbi:polysaccharide transporter, PST family [Izhakiella capsodis]|uniref:Polysaccharide transporter, PST family n=1 Tax=Izhakiella capsodis TaxID=1367852 RepID=A0A1I4UV74_9GAMM|nr:polysaccharide transporter, PST family [Izhakiella capsodis]